MQSTDKTLVQALDEAYKAGSEVHGYLDVQPKDFAPHLRQIVHRHLGTESTDSDATNYLSTLHITDLYLSIACARKTEAGWNRFASIYRNFIQGVAYFACQRTITSDLADNILVNLFLPNRSGQSRIASYEGRSSLATWLRVVICHQAANERELICNNLDGLDSLVDISDDSAIDVIDAKLRACRYERVIRCALFRASKSLTERERLMLLMRYREGLRLGQMARILNIHQSTVTRQIESACAKIRREMIGTFTAKYNLQPAAVGECWEEMLNNPSYSILAALESR